MHRVIVAIVATLLLAVAAHESTGQTVLSLETAVQEALAHNRPLQASRHSTAEAASRIRESRSALFPTLRVSEAWQRGNQPVFVFSSLLASRTFSAANFAIDTLNRPDAQSFFQTTVGVDQLVFDGGRVRAMMRAAELQHAVADTYTEEARAGVIVGVTEAYGRVLASQAARRSAELGLEAAREDVGRLRARREAGMATDADVLSLEVHASELEQRRIQAEGDAAIARAELNRLIGAPIERAFEVVEPPLSRFVGTGSSRPDLDVAPLTVLVQEAVNYRPELRRALHAEALSQAVRQQARAAFLPQVAAQAAFEVNGTTLAERASAWVIGGQVRWSFSTGGADLARLRAAAEAASRSRLEHAEAKAAVEVEVVTARHRLESALARETVGRATVIQARESHRIIRDRFDAGLATVTDVLRASAAVQAADAQHTGAVVEALLTRAMLDKSTGRSDRPTTLPDRGTQTP